MCFGYCAVYAVAVACKQALAYAERCVYVVSCELKVVHNNRTFISQLTCATNIRPNDNKSFCWRRHDNALRQARVDYTREMAIAADAPI